MKIAVIVCLLVAISLCGIINGSPLTSDKRAKRSPTLKKVAKTAAQVVAGAVEMGKAYLEMREANSNGYIEGSDKYFHAKGNYKASKHGPGGKWIAKTISDARENIQMAMGGSKADSAADQKANNWGQDGKDPNHFRPKDLPGKYRR